MSALRALSRPARSLPSLTRQCRFASHDSHHHHHEHDTTVYPKESFLSSSWRNTILAVLGITAFVKFAPEDIISGKDGEAPWLTRVLAHNAPTAEEWIRTNAQHLAQSEEIAQNTIIVQTAKQPVMMRYRSPMKFEQVSPHSVPVGGLADMSDLIVKS